jgi:hypothetical protein
MKIIDFFDTAFPADQVFGVRVILPVTYSTGETGYVTALINALGECDVDAVVAQAGEMYISPDTTPTSAKQRGGSNPITAVGIGGGEVGAVTVGGYDGALTTMVC